jgi:hypothetical protein
MLSVGVGCAYRRYSLSLGKSAEDRAALRPTQFSLAMISSFDDPIVQQSCTIVNSQVGLSRFESVIFILQLSFDLDHARLPN